MCNHLFGKTFINFYKYFPILENLLTNSHFFSNLEIRSEYDYPSQLFRATNKVER